MGTFELSEPEVLEILRADERTLPFSLDDMDPENEVTYALAQMREDHVRLQAARIVRGVDGDHLTNFDEVLDFMVKHGTPVDLWKPFGMPIQVTVSVNRVMAEMHLMLSGFNFLETVGERRARMRAIVQVAAHYHTQPVQLMQGMEGYEVHVLRLCTNPDDYRRRAVAAFDQHDQDDLLRVATKMADTIEAFCLEHQDRLPSETSLELPVPDLSQYTILRAGVIQEIESYIETVWPGYGRNWNTSSNPINA